MRSGADGHPAGEANTSPPRLMSPEVCACTHLGRLTAGRATLNSRRDTMVITPTLSYPLAVWSCLTISPEIPLNSDVPPFNEERVGKQSACQPIPSIVFVNSLSGLRAVPVGTAHRCVQFSGQILRFSGRHWLAPPESELSTPKNLLVNVVHGPSSRYTACHRDTRPVIATHGRVITVHAW